MDFFQHQERTRRQSRRLVFLFILAILAMVAVIDLVLLVGFGIVEQQGGTALSADGAVSNWGLLAGGSLATLSVIGLASLFKTLALRGGGGHVAAQLGGVRVDPDVREPLRRRLVNVVEEIALASGVPVPEVWVLEQESGINAFAAGYSPADAAVAVTRGALEHLDRNELQGVIAHEFSHILNGDMRLNIRLMGALFGILLLAIIGRRILLHSHVAGRSRNKEGAAIMALALTLVVVGYIGLFFGRWIKSAVSRQREYLADASAVQFTREPEGIAGALKKIAVYSDGSILEADSEEVGHMLFGAGRAASLFATHPPLADRIRRIEPSFQPEDLKVLARRIQRQRADQVEREERAQRDAGRPRFFDTESLIGQIGNPDFERLLLAAVVSASIPEPARRAAQAVDRAPDSVLYALLHEDDEHRERQLLSIATELGQDTEARVRHLATAAGPLDPVQRLPVLEIALPALHRQPRERIAKLLQAVDQMVRVDGRLSVFEYLAVRIIRQYAWESQNPHRVRTAGNKHLDGLREPALAVLAILAQHGHERSGDAGAAAWAAGAQVLFPDESPERPDTGDWADTLDQSLDRLDGLKAEDKKRLVEALIVTVSHDGDLVPKELELMRAICASLHVPIPVVGAAQGAAAATP